MRVAFFRGLSSSQPRVNTAENISLPHSRAKVASVELRRNACRRTITHEADSELGKVQAKRKQSLQSRWCRHRGSLVKAFGRKVASEDADQSRGPRMDLGRETPGPPLRRIGRFAVHVAMHSPNSPARCDSLRQVGGLRARERRSRAVRSAVADG